MTKVSIKKSSYYLNTFHFKISSHRSNRFWKPYYVPRNNVISSGVKGIVYIFKKNYISVRWMLVVSWCKIRPYTFTRSLTLQLHWQISFLCRFSIDDFKWKIDISGGFISNRIDALLILLFLNKKINFVTQLS